MGRLRQVAIVNLLQCFQVSITLFALLSAVREKYQAKGLCSAEAD